MRLSIKGLRSAIMILVAAGMLVSCVSCAGRSEALPNSILANLPDGNTSYFDQEFVPLYDNSSHNAVISASCASSDVSCLAIQEIQDPESQSGIVTSIHTYNRSTAVTSSIDVSERIGNGYFISLAIDKNGTIYVFSYLRYGTSDSSFGYFPVFSDGSIGENTSLEVPENFAFYSCVADSNGNIFLGGSGQILVFNNSGKIRETIDETSLTGDLFSLDGGIYGLERSETTPRRTYIAAIDEKNKRLGAPVDMSSIIGSEDIPYSGGKYLCMNSNTGITGIDPQTGDSKIVFLWKNCTIPVEDTSSYQLVFGNDDRMMLLPVRTNFMNLDIADLPDSFGIYTLTNNPDSPLANRTEIVVGGANISGDPAIRKCVNDFNNQNEDYRIVLRDYCEDTVSLEDDYDWEKVKNAAKEKMNLDILSGNAPDILIGASEDLLDIYAGKDLLVDLLPLMSNDSTFSSGDLVPSVLANLQDNGHLYRLCTGFTIHGIAGAETLLGNRTGWTFEEFDAFAKTLPENMQVFPYSVTQTGLLEACYNSGTVDEPDNWDALLDFAKMYGHTDEEASNMSSSTHTQLKNGRLALTEASIGSAFQYRGLIGRFGTDIELVGFPAEEDSRPTFIPANSVAIMTSANDTAACWEFLSTLFGEEFQTAYKDSYLSMLSSVLALQVDGAKDPDYMPESGNWDGESTAPLTDEQVQDFYAIIQNAKLENLCDKDITAILAEESLYYFGDQKSREEVASLIAGRIETQTEERG